jgi:hypothetical protein
MYDALLAAALAKCVEYNGVVNRQRRYEDEAFALVSGLRGICEDLIVLCFLKRLSSRRREELT